MQNVGSGGLDPIGNILADFFLKNLIGWRAKKNLRFLTFLVQESNEAYQLGWSATQTELSTWLDNQGPLDRWKKYLIWKLEMRTRWKELRRNEVNIEADGKNKIKNH